MASVTDATGAVLYETAAYGSAEAMYAMPVENLLRRAALSRRLAEGQEYTLTVSALVGNGETLPVYSGTFIL